MVVVIAVLALGFIGWLLERGNKEGGDKGNTKQEPSPPARDTSAAEALALSMSMQFQENGDDMLASYDDTDYALNVSSPKTERFKRKDDRVDFLNELVQGIQGRPGMKSKMCAAGIWHITASYSEGLLSGEFTTSRSLHCPQEKAVRTQELKDEREKWAAGLSIPPSDEAGPGLQAHAEGTTLVRESDFFADPAKRSMVVKSLLGADAMQNVCRLYFTQLQLKSKQKVVKTTPFVCK